MLNKKYFLILLALILMIGTINLFFPRELEATIYGSICGKVISGDTGKPLEKVIVYLYVERPNFGIMDGPPHSTTDKEGNFCFKMCEEGKYYLTFKPPHPYIGNHYLFMRDYISGRISHWPYTVILDKGANVNINIIVDQIGGSISGRVLKADGITPFPGVDVIAGSPGKSTSGDRSREDGSFSCKQLIPSDDYTLTAGIDGYGNIRITEIRVESKKDTSGIDIIIKTDDPTGVEGIVTRPDGTPLERGGVALDRKDKIGGGSCSIDKDGRYSISGLEPGIYTMSIIGGQKIKNIEGVVIEKGIKIKIDVGIDDPVKEKSGCSETTSNQMIFFIP